MRKNFQVIFIISILVALIFFSACTTSSPENQASQQNSSRQSGALIPVTGEGESRYINFDVIKADLPVYPSGNDTPSSFVKPVYSITGIDVDESGDARSWIFGVRDPDGTKMLAYDRNGWITLPWNSTTDLDVIPVDSIISPGHLFSKNAAVIAGNPSPAVSDRRDLELKQGVYTITILSGNTTRILTFNAITGELMTHS